MLKNIWLILFLSFLPLGLAASNEKGNSLFQFDFGINRSLKKIDGLLGLQTGLRWYPKHKNVYLGIQNIYCYKNKKYNWPDFDEYSYARNIDCFSPLIGINLYQSQKVDIEFNIRYNFVTYSGKLKTDNPLLKEYLLNNYSGYHGGFGFSTRGSYKITKYIGIYADISLFKLTTKNPYYFFGIGSSISFGGE